MKIEIRQESLVDAGAIAHIHREAFGQDNEAQLVAKIRESDRYFPSLSLVAEVEGEKVGHILLSGVDLVGTQTYPVLALAPLAVLPTFQNQGIGSKLVKAALAEAETQGQSLVIVLGHPQFYPRFGFEPAQRYQIDAPFAVPEDVFMVKLLSNYQPNYQGKVIYPQTFMEV